MTKSTQTTSRSQSRTRRKKVTTTPKKQMTESTYVKPKVKNYKHTEPVIIDSHLENVQVLSTAAYVQDFKNRLHLNNVEVKELIDAHVEMYNYVKPYVVSTYNKVAEYVKTLRKESSD